MADRRQDNETRDRISQMQKEYRALAERNWNRINQIHDGYRRLNGWVRWVLAFLVVMQIATGITLGFFEADATHTADRAKQLAVAIQQERHDNTLSNCS